MSTEPPRFRHTLGRERREPSAAAVPSTGDVARPETGTAQTISVVESVAYERGERVAGREGARALHGGRAGALRERGEQEPVTAERIRLLVDDSHEIAFRLRLGPEPAFEYVSAATARILGFPSARFYEEPRFALDHIHPEDRDIALDLRTRNNGLAPVRWLHPDGSIVWLEPRMRSLHDHDGRVIALEGVVRDVSERVEAEERRQALDAELQERQRFDAIARLAGGIAHDFNNLLLAVRGYGETALLRLQADESGAAPYVQEMLAAAERAAELTRQLLAFSRRQLLNPQVLDLNEVVGQMEGPLRRMLGPDVEAALPATSPCWSRWTLSQLEQVLANLAVNARDAMERRGRLTIELAAVRDREPSAEVARTSSVFGVLTVKDCGVGMDAETTARIFDPLHDQGAWRRNRPGPGSPCTGSLRRAAAGI